MRVYIHIYLHTNIHIQQAHLYEDQQILSLVGRRKNTFGWYACVCMHVRYLGVRMFYLLHI